MIKSFQKEVKMEVKLVKQTLKSKEENNLEV